MIPDILAMAALCDGRPLR